jgi:hypothetical protein
MYHGEVFVVNPVVVGSTRAEALAHIEATGRLEYMIGGLVKRYAKLRLKSAIVSTVDTPLCQESAGCLCVLRFRRVLGSAPAGSQNESATVVS